LTDLRNWIKAADEEAMLRRVKDETDVRRISGIMNESRSVPVLFENLVGYDSSMIGQTISSKKLVAFALETEPTDNSIKEEYCERVSKPVKPVYVDSAPFHEIIKTGDEIDLTELPIPLQHSRDGGAYISAGVQVTKDPGTYIAEYEGELNLGCYRHMVYTRNLMGIDFVSANRTNVFYKKLMEEGKPLEMAILIGVHPLTFMAAVAPARDIDVLGGLHKKPVELVPCRTIDLHVPRNVEIVIEGEIPPSGWTTPEGPYGEFTGYQSARKANPVFKVKALMHRKKPIFHTVTIGTRDFVNTDTYHIRYALNLQKENTLNRFQSMGFDVRDITSKMGFTVISMKKWFEGQARSLIYRFGNTRTHYPKFVIVVDDDIDVNNLTEIDWAMTHRCNPEEDIIIKTGIPAKPLDPSNIFSAYNAVASRLGIDATKPLPPYSERWKWVESTVPYQEDIAIGRTRAREGEALEKLSSEIHQVIIDEPLWFYEVLERWGEYEYRSLLLAMTKLFEENKIIQNDIGQWEQKQLNK
jgi:2,5-furandicarboxylate decarboxylase 1